MIARPCQAGAAPAVAMTEASTACLSWASTAGIAGRREAPDTMSGWIPVPDEPIEMIAFGNQAPAVLGLGFGVRFTLAPGPDAQMRYSVTHPPIPPSGGTTQSWSSMLMAGTTDSAFFQFDVPAELQPGVWSFTIEADGETLFTMAFQVMKAEDLPALANLCRDGSLLSDLRISPNRAPI